MSTRRRATIANSNMAPPPPATPRAQTGRRTPRASLNLVASAQQQQRARATNLPTPHPPARQPATSRRAKPWRQSIVDGSTNYNTLSERAQLVKGPATVALLGMLALGTQDDDSQGDDGDSGDMRLNDTRKTEYAAFEGQLHKVVYRERDQTRRGSTLEPRCCLFTRVVITVERAWDGRGKTSQYNN